MTKKPGVVYNPPQQESFDISEVYYRGEVGSYNVLTHLTNPISAAGVVRRYNKDRFQPLTKTHVPANSILTFSIFQAAYNHRGPYSTLDALQLFLKNAIGKDLNTSTRIVYSPHGEDKIVHNYGTVDEYFFNVKIPERDGWIKNLSDPSFLEFLLGTSNVKDINNVLRWINELEGFVIKPHEDPQEKEQRVFGFYREDGKVGLDCDGSLAAKFPVLLVKRID